jgi:3-dehydroquinate dehydratase/shikimate dehydrogenase
MGELCGARDRAAGADLVELRLDTVDRPDVSGALAGRPTPVIVTCRPEWEGGFFRGSEEDRLGLLAEAQALGAEYVDIEWRADHAALVKATGGRGVVISTHDFKGVPADLPQRVRAMRGTGAEVVKVAVTATRLSDCLALLPLAREDSPAAVMAMGLPGLPSRVLGARFGSCWTYAGNGVAPGQIPVSRMLEEFRFRSIGPDTAVYGLLGRPVSHSVSPAMHNAAFAAADLDAVYLPLEADSFDDFDELARALGIAGASVTAPFKVDAFERVASADAVGRRIGAVNTLKREDGRWAGRNTDVEGFLAPLHPVEQWAGKRATVLGAGGAARSVVEALQSIGVLVTVAARRGDAADAIAGSTGATAGAWPPAAGAWDLLVNATPVGTCPDAASIPIPDDLLTGSVVYDLVYNPPRTRLLKRAAARGCRTIGGLDMLVAQAEAQFEWWTGIQPAPNVMRDAALVRLAGIAQS